MMMTPAQIVAALKEIESAIPTKAPRASLYFHVYGKPLHGTIYENWPNDGPAISIEADDWEEALDALRQAWDRYYAASVKQRIRAIALEIIRLTAEHGECTDAALRGHKFSDAEISQFGEAACAEANRMAANGPFSIVSAGKSNGAPAAEAAE